MIYLEMYWLISKDRDFLLSFLLIVIDLKILIDPRPLAEGPSCPGAGVHLPVCRARSWVSGFRALDVRYLGLNCWWPVQGSFRAGSHPLLAIARSWGLWLQGTLGARAGLGLLVGQARAQMVLGKVLSCWWVDWVQIWLLWGHGGPRVGIHPLVYRARAQVNPRAGVHQLMSEASPGTNDCPLVGRVEQHTLLITVKSVY